MHTVRAQVADVNSAGEIAGVERNLMHTCCTESIHQHRYFTAHQVENRQAHFAILR